MIPIDTRTIALVIALVSALQTITLTLYYFTVAHPSGLIWWVGGAIINDVGWFLLLVQDIFPDIMPIVVANSLLIVAMMMFYRGLARFLEFHNVWQERFVTAITFAGILGLVFFQSAAFAGERMVIMSLSVALISGCCAWNLWHDATTLSIWARFIAVIVTLYSIWCFYQTIVTSVLPTDPTLFTTTSIQTATFVGIVCGMLLCTAGLISMRIQRRNPPTNEQLFRQSFDQSPFGAALINVNYDCICVNDVLSAMIGNEKKDLINTRLTNLIHPEDRTRITTHIQKLFTRDISHFTIDQRWKQVNGGTIWVQVSAHRLYNDPDSDLAIVLQTIEITAQKQIEANLQQRIDELQSINRITQIIAGWTNVPDSIRNVAIEVQTLFGASTVSIWIYDGNESIRRQISLTTTEANTQPYTRMLASSPLAQRLRTQKTVLVVETSDDQLIAAQDPPNSAPRRTLLVPLIMHGEALGLMCINAKQAERVYTSDDLALAQTIAAPLATAIENARLLGDIQTSAAENERLLERELHESVSQTLLAAHRVAEILPDLWELDPEEGRAGLHEIGRLTQSALAEMRALRLELRP